MKLFLAFLLGSVILGVVARRWNRHLVSALLFVVVVGVAAGYFFFNQI